MRLVDVGRGTPLVIVPGVQGRWEWMKPAVDALAQRCRVITFSLADEPTCGGRFDEGRGFDCYVDQVAEALDAAGVERAAICGVSYGGLIAAAFAARHPHRVANLLLVSAMPPGWQPNARVRFYLRAPRLLFPVFLLASVRMYREIAAASPTRAAGIVTSVRHALNALTHMLSPGRVARRVHVLNGVDVEPELARVHVPTLVITGEAALDNVMPVPLTHRYVRLWPHAEVRTLPRTGHIGLVTRPLEFAEMVTAFIDRESEGGRRRRVG